jgi:hypothetical protein
MDSTIDSFLIDPLQLMEERGAEWGAKEVILRTAEGRINHEPQKGWY